MNGQLHQAARMSRLSPTAMRDTCVALQAFAISMTEAAKAIENAARLLREHSKDLEELEAAMAKRWPSEDPSATA